jgi:preprotein translocase subunit SecF
LNLQLPKRTRVNFREELEKVDKILVCTQTSITQTLRQTLMTSRTMQDQLADLQERRDELKQLMNRFDNA